ncbi:SMR family transporter [Salmonella enterica]
MGSCAAPSAKGDDKFITTDYLQQCLTAMVISMALLSWAMKTLPVGTAYAIWTGIGAVGAAITGILLLGESASPARLLSLGLIVAGIIGLKLSAH